MYRSRPDAKQFGRNQKSQKNGIKQSLDVYCRLRPISSPSSVCMKVVPPSVVHVIQPSALNSHLRNGTSNKEIQYTFKQVFDKDVSQKDLFNTVALPLVENLLKGGNGLLFTYGVTGSGKTYTMTGNDKDTGIMPRCIATIFKSIGAKKASKYVFKPDKLNGFDIQSEADALIERQQDFIAQLTPAKNKQPKSEQIVPDMNFLKRTSDVTKITSIVEDNVYSVFVTFVEIYNNSVYDLLDDSTNDGLHPRTPQVKIIREDANHNMFVHGVNELEVTTTEEAFQAFCMGQKRRRIAHTALNAESSRAHTIFTIRVVQCPTDDHDQIVLEKEYMQVGQLSLVDLAGSERTNRTNNTGQRLREAGNINNSLMALRNCLEILRENQKGANKMVPYRDSRLTHLFKTFFEGEGLVAMVVCVNPRADDYDENLHVLKFAEVSQELQITCPSQKPVYHHRPKNQVRRHLNLDDDDEYASKLTRVNKIHEFLSDIPFVGYVAHDDDSSIFKKCISYLESHTKSLDSVGIAFLEKVIGLRENARKVNQEKENLKVLLDRERGRSAGLESRIKTADLAVASYKRKIDETESNVKRLRRELSDKDILLGKNKIDSTKAKEEFNSKIARTEEKLKSEMERKLRSQKSALEFELRSKERRLQQAKRVLSDESLRSVPSTPQADRTRVPFPCTPLSMRPPSPNFRSTGRKLVAGRRPRRSRSAETWLEHKPPAPSNLLTVLQPVITKRRSVSKLTDAKDITSSGADRYCLVVQGQDSDGDLEARIYKGDINPTTGGGAQVLFSDVEILKQKSPTSPTKLASKEETKKRTKPTTSRKIENRFKY